MLKNSYIKVIVIIACLLLSLLSLHVADPIEGRVFDAETRQPLEDVVVVARWYQYIGSLADSGGPSRSIDVQESVTDDLGLFYIPGWKMRFVFLLGGYWRDDQPLLFLFKEGYLPLNVSSHFDSRHPNVKFFRTTFRFPSSDKKIYLHKIKNGDRKLNTPRYWSAEGTLALLDQLDTVCLLKRAPKFLTRFSNIRDEEYMEAMFGREYVENLQAWQLNPIDFACNAFKCKRLRGGENNVCQGR